MGTHICDVKLFVIRNDVAKARRILICNYAALTREKYRFIETKIHDEVMEKIVFKSSCYQ